MKKLHALLISLICIWFVACSALIFWFSTTSKTQFDPDMLLSQGLMDLHFETNLVAALQANALSMPLLNDKNPLTQIRGTVFHITQGDCYCEWLAQAHQEKINIWSGQHQLKTVNINIDSTAQLAQFVPSTPAIAIVDSQNTLVYFGPYSRGSGCFGQSGQVDNQLEAWFGSSHITTVNTKVNITSAIDVDATGCYCAT